MEGKLVARGQALRLWRFSLGLRPRSACLRSICSSKYWNSRGFRRRGSASVQNLLWRFSLNKSACSSHAVEDLDSPQHDDDSQYQRSHRQYTLQGSDSHATLRLPSPILGLVDSLISRQSPCPQDFEKYWAAVVCRAQLFTTSTAPRQACSDLFCVAARQKRPCPARPSSAMEPSEAINPREKKHALPPHHAARAQP